MTLAEIQTALAGADEVEITVTGRQSGRQISIPVWFVRGDDRLYLLPVRGSDSDWYRNATKTPPIALKAAGTAWTGAAIPVTDPGRVNEAVEQFQAKYGAGQVRRYYSKVDVAVVVPLSEVEG